MKLVGLVAWLALVNMLSAATLSDPRRMGTDFEFSVTGASNAIYAIETSLDLRSWTRVATNRQFGEVRTIRMPSGAQQEFYRARSVRPLFTGALAVSESVEFVGTGGFVDSFDSRDPRFFRPDGTLEPSQLLDYGDIVTSSALSNSLLIGNAHIYGKLRAPVDSGAVLGPNGGVGSLLWHLNGGRGIQDGWFLEGTAHIVDAELPQGHVYVTPAPGSVDGTNYTYVLSNGHYTLPQLTLSSMLVTGRATLHVSGSAQVGGTIVITRNASLDLYVGGASASISLAEVVNESRNAAAFAYYGLPGNTNVSVGASGSFSGTFYAPAADVTFGGSDYSDICGAVVGRTIKVNGRLRIRYDQALAVTGPVW